ncbi:MAG: HI0074 family nucleotidyltransferase substrate-binding subunit [Bdellovibrionales bacterium]
MAISSFEFNKALSSLKDSMDLYYSEKNNQKSQKAYRDSCIQRFEYSIELSWKTAMKILGSDIRAAKPAVREMARNNLISSPSKWFDFIDARNSSSHSYDEDIATRVFKQIEAFYPEAMSLSKKLEDLM